MKIIIILFCLGLIGCATVSREDRIPSQAKKTAVNANFISMDQKELDSAIAIFSASIKNNRNHAGTYYNRALAYFYKKDYDKSWKDVHEAERLGIEVNQRFLELIDKLKKASGREK